MCRCMRKSLIYVIFHNSSIKFFTFLGAGSTPPANSPQLTFFLNPIVALCAASTKNVLKATSDTSKEEERDRRRYVAHCSLHFTKFAEKIGNETTQSRNKNDKKRKKTLLMIQVRKQNANKVVDTTNINENQIQQPILRNVNWFNMEALAKEQESIHKGKMHMTENAGENSNNCGVASSKILGIDETTNTATRLRNPIVEIGESSRGPIDIDDRILNGRGPKPFSIYGELKHRVGALLPDLGKQVAYAQLYFYDSTSALKACVSRNPQLNTDVLKIIQDNLMEYNPFVQIYRQAYEVLNDGYSADY
ncbi:hypothetical protein GIB67_032460 [Kingdonia uniflora]|uniref:Uncharacterized protein n=1 Tax=Kingdonia uniflora TaxID=39325 RepID=A0A7J7L7E7_9MAGN|nr:hypothetical protein GIB67_032460 [Kingdonia uniflora]